MSSPRVEEPDLAVVLGGAAVLIARERADEVGAAVAPPHALELAAAGDLVVAELLARGAWSASRSGTATHSPRRSCPAGGDGEVGDVPPRRVVALHAPSSVAGVVGEPPEHALAAAAARVGRRQPVEQAVRLARVLGQVDRAACGSTATASCAYRPSALIGTGSRLASGRTGRPRTRSRAAVCPPRLLGLLAGQPGVPRRPAARAVVVRAGEADVLADAPAVRSTSMVVVPPRRPGRRRGPRACGTG